MIKFMTVDLCVIMNVILWNFFIVKMKGIIFWRIWQHGWIYGKRIFSNVIWLRIIFWNILYFWCLFSKKDIYYIKNYKTKVIKKTIFGGIPKIKPFLSHKSIQYFNEWSLWALKRGHKEIPVGVFPTESTSWDSDHFCPVGGNVWQTWPYIEETSG